MKNILTLVMLSPVEISIKYTDVDVVLHISKFDNLVDLHKERLLAIRKVKTPYFMFLDSDDDLSDNYLDIFKRLIDKMIKENKILGYTNYRRIYTNTTNTNQRPIIKDFIIGNFNVNGFRNNLHYLHHSVVLNTAATLKLLDIAPYGLYNTPYLLFHAMSRNGAVYIPEICYIYNQYETGMHTNKSNLEAYANTIRWCLNTKNLGVVICQ